MSAVKIDSAPSDTSSSLISMPIVSLNSESDKPFRESVCGDAAADAACAAYTDVLGLVPLLLSMMGPTGSVVPESSFKVSSKFGVY